MIRPSKRCCAEENNAHLEQRHNNNWPVQLPFTSIVGLEKIFECVFEATMR